VGAPFDLLSQVYLRMDQLDRDIIRLLQRDSRLSFTRIARELQKPDTTVHFRMRKLVRDKIVARFSALVRPEALGYGVACLFRIEIGGHILPDISKDRTRTFAEEIAREELCLWVALDNEPMIIHALVLGIDDKNIEEHANTLRKSPDVVKVSVIHLRNVVKGWEISGVPEVATDI